MNSLSISYDNTWRTLEEYNFNINTQLHSDLLCIMCKNILKNAHQTPCGCRYCHACIINLMNNQIGYCIGDTEDCKRQMINSLNEVHVDNAANRLISGLIVKCPEEFCSFTCELKSMDIHMSEHQIKCPFSYIGCSHPRIGMEKMVDHLHIDNYSHSSLLMDSIQNSKNEMSFLKENSLSKDMLMSELQRRVNLLEEKFSRNNSNSNYDDRIKRLSLENRKLTSDFQGAMRQIIELQAAIDSQQEVIKRMERQMDEVHIAHTMQLKDLEDNDSSYKNQINNLEIQITSINMDYRTVQESIDDQQERIEEIETEVKELSHTCLRTTQEINQYQKVSDRFRAEYEQIQSEIVSMKEEFREEKEIISDMKISVNHIESNQTIANLEMERKESQSIVVGEQKESTVENDTSSVQLGSLVSWGKRDEELENRTISTAIIAPFNWKIDNFFEKRQKAQAGLISFINSDPFYSHESGYKLCLSVFPDGCGSGKRSHLTVGCRIMKGEYDDQLSWPMKLAITISLIDQKFDVVFTSHQFQYSSVSVKSRVKFDRPKHVINEGVGATRFISLNKLLNDARLFRNDSIILRCVTIVNL